MSGITLTDVSARHPHGPDVVHSVHMQARRGRITALVGPNGSGKSSLLKSILGLLPARGEVSLDGELLAPLERTERARRIAYVPQRTRLLARLDVRSVVSQGRFVHLRGLSSLRRSDHEAVDHAMKAASIAHLATRPFPELSGGEQARVVLARALATGATALLLDEPTAALDVRQVLALHTVLRQLADDGCCVLIVLHDLAEVRRHADDAVLLHEGRVYDSGPVEAVVSEGPIRAVYGVELFETPSVSWRLPQEGT